jgi:hypothetical protein
VKTLRARNWVLQRRGSFAIGARSSAPVSLHFIDIVSYAYVAYLLFLRTYRGRGRFRCRCRCCRNLLGFGIRPPRGVESGHGVSCITCVEQRMPGINIV